MGGEKGGDGRQDGQDKEENADQLENTIGKFLIFVIALSFF